MPLPGGCAGLSPREPQELEGHRRHLPSVTGHQRAALMGRASRTRTPHARARAWIYRVKGFIFKKNCRQHTPSS